MSNIRFGMSFKTIGLALCIVVLFIPHLPAQSSGQTTGDIRGLARDVSGAAIAGAEITARNIETNLARQVKSGDTGGYLIPLLPPGIYDVSCSVAGFRTETRCRVTISPGSVAEVPFVLAVPEMAAAAVEVIAGAEPLEPAKTQNSTVVTPRQIENLPINQRNYLAFSLITPAVDSDRIPQQGTTATSGLTFNGQSSRYNNVMVDGLDNNDNAPGGVRTTVSQAAVKEFQVVANNYSAEYGRATGGIVNIVTKSGTNRWHGEAFFFGRNQHLDADEVFAPEGENPPFTQLQYGFTLGGPIRKDKTFMFVSFERLDIRNHNIVTIDPVATTAIEAAGFPIETGALPYRYWNNNFSARVDHLFDPNNTVTARLSHAGYKNENQEPWGGLLAKSRGGFLDFSDTAVSIGWDAILSPTLLNTVRFQFARHDHDFQTFDPVGPTVEILGVATIGRQYLLPQPRLENYYQVTDTFSWIRDNHSIKAGVDAEIVTYDIRMPLYFGGRFVFSTLPANALYPGSPAMTALEAFKNGFPAIFLQGFGDERDTMHTGLFSAFAQYDWRLGRNLTLKIGVRYDRESLPEPVPRDNDNFSPRLAIAWLADDGRTNLRAAAGRFYGVSATGDIFAVRVTWSDRIRAILLRGMSARAAWLQPGHRYTEDPGFTPYPLRYQIDNQFETAHADQFSAGVDRALTRDISLHASFQYIRGRDYLVGRNINPIVDPATGRRPYPGYADIYNYESSGNSWHRGLTLSLEQRQTRGLQFLFSYTLSTTEDDFVDILSTYQNQDPLHPEEDRGPSLQDERHRLVFSSTWDLGGYTDNAILDNFRLGSIVTYGSGRPFNILAGYDRNGNGDPTTDRPPGVGRNTGDGPSYFSVDIRLSREFPFSGGDRDLELLLEVFNLFNRENYSTVNPVWGPGAEPLPSFGQWTSAYPARQLQLGVRFRF